jgi:hypothetical protein
LKFCHRCFSTTPLGVISGFATSCSMDCIMIDLSLETSMFFAQVWGNFTVKTSNHPLPHLFHLSLLTTKMIMRSISIC